MTRREWIRVSTAATASPAFAVSSQAAIQGEIVRLKLRHTWTTVMSSSDLSERVPNSRMSYPRKSTWPSTSKERSTFR